MQLYVFHNTVFLAKQNDEYFCFGVTITLCMEQTPDLSTLVNSIFTRLPYVLEVIIKITILTLFWLCLKYC